MNWFREMFNRKRKVEKIRLTFRADNCIKIYVPGHYGLAGNQLMETLKMTYGYYPKIGQLGGGIGF